MNVTEFDIAGAWEVTPKQYPDDRGVFLEWYRADVLAGAVGHPFRVKQVNMSVSTRGALRGIHYALVPPGQAKYVTVTHGAVLDFVVDVRTGSPTFGRWGSVLLDDVDRRAVYISEGLGHAFVALSETATMSYLVSEHYTPAREFSINPLDPAIGLQLPSDILPVLLSPRDAVAPSLAAAESAGRLPSWQDCRDFYATLEGSR